MLARTEAFALQAAPTPPLRALLDIAFIGLGDQARRWEREHAALLAENAALRAENAVLQARIHDLEARLGQNSANSSRPPSSDQPHVPPKQRGTPSRRKRGGQPGHRGTYHALLPVEQVDEIVAVAPERRQHCGEPSTPGSTRLPD